MSFFYARSLLSVYIMALHFISVSTLRVTVRVDACQHQYLDVFSRHYIKSLELLNDRGDSDNK